VSWLAGERARRRQAGTPLRSRPLAAVSSQQSSGIRHGWGLSMTSKSSSEASGRTSF
jgi:hypothetical protein